MQIILVLKLAEVSRHYLSWSQGNNEGHWRVAVPLSRGSSQPRVKARSPTLQVDSSPAEPQGKSKNTGVGSLSLLQSIFLNQESNGSPALQVDSVPTELSEKLEEKKWQTKRETNLQPLGWLILITWYLLLRGYHMNYILFILFFLAFYFYFFNFILFLNFTKLY